MYRYHAAELVPLVQHLENATIIVQKLDPTDSVLATTSQLDGPNMLEMMR